MTTNLFEEFGARCWYCGAPKPFHEKFPDYEINACRSCIRIRSKNGLEEFRLDFAHRKMARRTDLKAHPHSHTRRAGDLNQIFDEFVPRTHSIVHQDKFYFEELALDSLSDMESVRNRRWHDTRALSSSDLLKELGSKCWYCGKLLCRHKQEWRDIKIQLSNGKYIEGRECYNTIPYYGRPTHDHVGNVTVNSCPSCTSRRHRKPIEEFRRWLGARKIPEVQELQSLETALATGLFRTDAERTAIEQQIQQLRVEADDYRFYMEELILSCAKAWHARNLFPA
jgi:hypothetical protein